MFTASFKPKSKKSHLLSPNDGDTSELRFSTAGRFLLMSHDLMFVLTMVLTHFHQNKLVFSNNLFIAWYACLYFSIWHDWLTLNRFHPFKCMKCEVFCLNLGVYLVAVDMVLSDFLTSVRYIAWATQARRIRFRLHNFTICEILFLSLCFDCESLRIVFCSLYTAPWLSG